MTQALRHLSVWIEQLLHHSLVLYFLYICHSSSSIHLLIDKSVGTKILEKQEEKGW
jgi:hypothetical protein